MSFVSQNTWRLVKAFALLVFISLCVFLALYSMETSPAGTVIWPSGAAIMSTFNPALYGRMELPLPEYIPHFKQHEMPLGENELAVCTPDDSILASSDPRPSRGCMTQETSRPGITLLCRTPIPISCSLTRSQAREQFFRNMVRTTVKCDGLTNVGNPRVDGVWRICMTPPYNLKKNSCLVYSMGINNEWSFDDEISKRYRCEVHSFDPTMGAKDHKRDDKITFHNLGVRGHGDRFKEAEKKGWKMMSLAEIMHFLGHSDRVIDILKLDIEYTEWDAFEDAIKSDALKNVKQIATEFHVWTDQVQSYVRFHRIISALENAGFEKWFLGYKGTFYKALNQETGAMSPYHYQVDMGFINTRFLK